METLRSETEVSLHDGSRLISELEDQLNTATRTTQTAIQEARDKDKDITKLRSHYDQVSAMVLA